MIDLKTIGEAIKLQDNRATRDPLFVVFQRREIVTDEDYDYDFIGWYDEDGHFLIKIILNRFLLGISRC